MKLHAVHRVGAVADGHDRAVFLRARHDFELRGHVIAGDHQRVVAAGDERLGDPPEEPFAVVHHSRRLPVHRCRGAADGPAIDDADRLMSKADAENRRTWSEAANDIDRHTGGFRAPGTGRDQDLLRCHRLDLADGHLIVAPDADVGAQLPEVLHEVVGERVVVVDDKYHYNPACASSSALRTARALSLVSSYSAVGLESATIPAPACT